MILQVHHLCDFFFVAMCLGSCIIIGNVPSQSLTFDHFFYIYTKLIRLVPVQFDAFRDCMARKQQAKSIMQAAIGTKQ